MSCGWVSCGALRWLPNTGPGMNSSYLVVFDSCGCAFYSTARKAPLGYVVACPFQGPHCLSKSWRNPLFCQLFLGQPATWKVRTLLHHFHTTCLEAWTPIRTVRCNCGVKSQDGACLVFSDHLSVSSQGIVMFLCWIRKKKFRVQRIFLTLPIFCGKTCL